MTAGPQAPLTVLSAADAEAASLLHGLCFAEAWQADALAALASDPSGLALAVWCACDELGGLVIARLAADESEILTLAVHPEHRRRGIARKLLTGLARDLTARGIARLFLEVATSNVAAVALYRGLGFVEVGLRRGYYAASGDDALVMRLDLAPHAGPDVRRVSDGRSM
ncbi:MAG: ribosomal-protein-alanine N-acetyltransferase [Rhizobiales bacterium]|nr:ribosomal-protein-alanine N-acetyltransferase [Hyphomicrobiales bacterium]